MKKSKKIACIAMIVLPTLLISVGAAMALGNSNNSMFAWWEPPSKRTDEPKGTAQYAAVESIDSTGKTLVSEGKRDFLLGYLENFRDEEVTGNESAAEAERITRKNTLIQEYREYVDALDGQMMTQEEYDAHYQHLMDIFLELLPLDPEPTPEKKIEIKIAQLLSGLEDDLCFSEINGESYIKFRRVDVSALKKSIEDLTSLQEKIDAKQLTLEQLQQEFAICLEVVKKASPEIYEAWILDE